MMRTIICVIMAMLLVALGASAAFAAQTPGIVEVTAIAETLEEGQKVTAVAIEYSEPIAAENITIDMFSVAGRTITKAYVNNSGVKGDVKTQGKYVMLELGIDPAPGNSVGSTLLYANGRNERLPIHLSIVQKVNITTVNGNTILPSGFTNTKEYNLEVDDRFKEMVYVNPETGATLNYRLFVPDNATDEPLPLVVFLHGIGERGNNNITQLLANRSALEWATPEAQAQNPCIVFAPQCPPDTTWAVNVGTDEAPVYRSSYALKNVKNVIDELIREYNIDTTRIYGTGLSMGSMGIWTLSMENPTLFAAQLNVCGANVYSDEQASRIVNKPIWGIVAVDDGTIPINMRAITDQFERLGGKVVRRIDDKGWNGFLRGKEAAEQALEQISEAKASGANILYTEYIAGTVVPFAHWSWMATYSNSAIRDWLFSHKAEVPYEPGQ